MAVGFSLTAFSLYEMTRMTLQMDSTLIIVSGFIQGLGIGFTFVPLSAAAFATLPPQLRNDGTPIFSLLRNIGSSVGISAVQTLLTEGTARAHATLAAEVSRTNLALQTLPPAMSPDSPAGLMALNVEVTRQAAMMGYLHDFRVMMMLTLVAMPLLLLIRRSTTAPGAASVADAPH
jgi:DHA2 family multidrug resistance protein